jgi:putative Holliday junction resolvase
MQFVALDIGDVRIGVAVCDALETAAYPAGTVQRVGSLKRDVAAVAAIVIEQEADGVVAGLPLSMDGTVGPQAEKVLGFVRALGRAVAVPVVTWDESLTSVDADELMIAHGASRRKRKEMIDQMAAVLILDSYLAHRRGLGVGLDAVTSAESHD